MFNHLCQECQTFCSSRAKFSSLRLSWAPIPETIKVMLSCEFVPKLPSPKDVFSKKKYLHVESISFLQLYFVAELLLSESFRRNFGISRATQIVEV